MEGTLKVFSEGQCSEEFARSFITSGSIVIDCEVCGRTHFTETETYRFEEGEFEELIKNTKSNPDKYIPNASDSDIRWGYIFGKRVVYDCPCGYDAYIEEILWHNRHWITGYFFDRSVNEAKAANDFYEKAKDAKEAVR